MSEQTQDSSAPGATDQREKAEPTGRGVVLSWSGRKNYRLLIPTPRILEPVRELSVDGPMADGNLVIEGDNRQVMASLLPQYARSVDVVLIDPPYNTGKDDFRYSDKRTFDPDADGKDAVWVSNEDGGRHTKWLNQMAPTFRLIYDLMADHAVLFCHIDDNELFNLGKLLDEILGEENRIGILKWKSAPSGNGDRIATACEYVLVYAKYAQRVAKQWRGALDPAQELMLQKHRSMVEAGLTVEEQRSEWTIFLRENRGELGSWGKNYKNVDEKGVFYASNLYPPSGAKGADYDLIHPVTRKTTKRPPAGYAMKREAMDVLLSKGLIHFGVDEKTVPTRKKYLSEEGDGVLPDLITHIPGRRATAEIQRLFPEDPGVFRYPKPAELEAFLLSFVAGRDALVLDCFAGSGTTGHAVMKLNGRDQGERRFILIDEGVEKVEGDVRYTRTLLAQRLKRAAEQEGLPGGFTFLAVGDEVDETALLRLGREQLANAICQADPTGRRYGMQRIHDARYVVGANRRKEAIALVWDGEGGDVTPGVLAEIFSEVRSLDLKFPVRVYGVSCSVADGDGFEFCQLPDSLIAAIDLGHHFENASDEPEVAA